LVSLLALSGDIADNVLREILERLKQMIRTALNSFHSIPFYTCEWVALTPVGMDVMVQPEGFQAGGKPVAGLQVITL
jgi:hypothetical protein